MLANAHGPGVPVVPATSEPVAGLSSWAMETNKAAAEMQVGHIGHCENRFLSRIAELDSVSNGRTR